MLAFPRNPKKEKVATPQEERIFTPLTRKVRLADENHNSVYRDYHYQRLNMGSAPGLRSIHPPGRPFPTRPRRSAGQGAPDVPRSVAFF